MAEHFRILSIDGGGIRGIIPAQILVALERKLQTERGDPDARIADHFDLIAGTSSGGILTCVYLCPGRDDPTRPRFSAQQVVDLLLARAHEIFDVPLWHRIRSAQGLLDEKYPAAGLEAALADTLGDVRLSALLKPCLVAAYDIERRKAHFFRQHRARAEPGRDFLARDVARAASASPTYFECAQIESDAHLTYPLIDGGVFANNPALCAYAEARAFAGVRAAEMTVLSLGTGAAKKPYPYAEAADWGAAGWVRPLIDIMMSGASEVVDYQLEQIYEAVGAPDQYLRIQPEIPSAHVELDNADPENLDALRQLGIEAAVAADERLSELARRLT